MSLKVTRSFDAARILTCSAMATIADALVRVQVLYMIHMRTDAHSPSNKHLPYLYINYVTLFPIFAPKHLTSISNKHLPYLYINHFTLFPIFCIHTPSIYVYIKNYVTLFPIVCANRHPMFRLCLVYI